MREIDITKVELSAKGMGYLILGIMIVMAVIFVASKLYGFIGGAFGGGAAATTAAATGDWG